jgi:hypothetical protein
MVSIRPTGLNVQANAFLQARSSDDSSKKQQASSNDPQAAPQQQATEQAVQYDGLGQNNKRKGVQEDEAKTLMTQLAQKMQDLARLEQARDTFKSSAQAGNSGGDVQDVESNIQSASAVISQLNDQLRFSQESGSVGGFVGQQDNGSRRLSYFA